MLVKFFGFVFYVSSGFRKNTNLRLHQEVKSRIMKASFSYFYSFSHFSNMSAILQKSDQQTCKANILLLQQRFTILNSQNSIYDENQSY